MISLREALDKSRLCEFIAQEEARGIGLIDRADFDAALAQIYPESLRSREKTLAFGSWPDSDDHMIRGGFLNEEDRKGLVALARDGSVVCRVTRRANALVLLDAGKSCQEVAEVLLFDDDTIRGWYELFEQSGVEGLTRFDVGGSSSKMSAEQAAALKAWVTASLPRSTRHVGAWIAKEFGLVYESRSGLIALLHRLGLEYHKPELISRKLDEKTQKAFIASYENLLNSMGDDEVALFVDAVHPTHAARPVGCWAPKEQNLAIEQTSGRQRINIHGAIDLETGQTRMIEAETIDAMSTIQLLESLELLYPLMACIHVFLDNARYHHAKLVKEWLSRPGCRIKLHFLPAYCPHLNPIAAMGRHAQEHHAQQNLRPCKEFAEATLDFLRDKVPRNWTKYRSTVTDNFRVISPKDFRVIA
jgi:transposase